MKVCLHDGVFNQILPEPEKGSQSSSPPILNIVDFNSYQQVEGPSCSFSAASNRST